MKFRTTTAALSTCFLSITFLTTNQSFAQSTLPASTYMPTDAPANSSAPKTPSGPSMVAAYGQVQTSGAGSQPPASGTQNAGAGQPAAGAGAAALKALEAQKAKAEKKLADERRCKDAHTKQKREAGELVDVCITNELLQLDKTEQDFAEFKESISLCYDVYNYFFESCVTSGYLCNQPPQGEVKFEYFMACFLQIPPSSQGVYYRSPPPPESELQTACLKGTDAAFELCLQDEGLSDKGPLGISILEAYKLRRGLIMEERGACVDACVRIQDKIDEELESCLKSAGDSGLF